MTNGQSFYNALYKSDDQRDNHCHELRKRMECRRRAGGAMGHVPGHIRHLVRCNQAANSGPLRRRVSLLQHRRPMAASPLYHELHDSHRRGTLSLSSPLPLSLSPEALDCPCLWAGLSISVGMRPPMQDLEQHCLHLSCGETLRRASLHCTLQRWEEGSILTGQQSESHCVPLGYHIMQNAVNTASGSQCSWR